MALQKQPVMINFAQGLETKTDPFQIPIGKFLKLENSIFDKAPLLKKQNGFKKLASVSDTTSQFVTTFNGNLTSVGQSLEAYSKGSQTWTSKGNILPLSLETLPLVRSNTNQSQCDSVVSSNGLVCTVFTDNVTATATTTTASYKYVIAEVETGQNIVAPTAIPVASGVVTGSPRVFLLGNYFVIVFTNVITAVNHLQYVAINIYTPTSVTANANISSAYTTATTVAFDGVVANNSLFLAWNGSDGGGAVRVTSIDSTLTQHSTVVFAGIAATLVSVTADVTSGSPEIYVFFYNLGTTNGYVFVVNQQLDEILPTTQIITTETVLNLASAAQNGLATLFYEVSNAYSYDSSIKTNYIKKRTVTPAGVLGTAATVKRSLGLASKAFIVDEVIYMLGAFSSPYQPSYFLINSSGTIVSKLAYSNGGGYLTTGLPSVLVSDGVASISYLIKDLVQAVNKSQTATSAAAVYSQTGVNLVQLTFSADHLLGAEIGSNLHLTGGLLWAYDGAVPVEQGFHLWPDSVECTWSATGGSIHAQPDGTTNTNAYYYKVTYEWTDAQGNLFRSAPSLPVGVTTTSNGTAGSITVNVPTLRLTAKTTNPVKIVIYRWSVAQQTYYQVTSITVPTLNSTTTDSIAFVDKLADASIIGNNILYTTGGVLENIGPPATSVTTLYKSRLFLVDAEDQNLVWYSKQVIESTPVEMSDLLTLYVAPTLGAQGNTGPIRALGAMDDKLVIFKKNAIFYEVGLGPDNTGANNDFNDPVFVTATVGCENPRSIVFIPNGLMFQSDKGIWLLGRDLSTSYIGAPVEAYNDDLVLSAINIPGTNQVRFTLSSGVTLMYDYFFNQWGTLSNIPSVSSTLFEDLHTTINSAGQVYQENPGSYLVGSKPVLMKFQTGWINLAGLQGFQRAYFFYLLGTYKSPHKLLIQIAYDYAPTPSQQVLISPENYSAPYGGEALYGSGSVYGGASQLEQWRIFFDQQKCESVQITVTEQFDPSFGTVAGEGLTLSGLTLMVGAKSAYPRLKAAVSAG